MDFRAAARSVLLVGRLKNDRNIRVMVHDKSSLAPEGNTRAFSLENGTLRWQDGYENLTADELLSGRSPDSKLTLAEQLILDTLDKHPVVPAKVMYRLAEQASISPRTLKEAKRNLTGSRRVHWYALPPCTLWKALASDTNPVPPLAEFCVPCVPSGTGPHSQAVPQNRARPPVRPQEAPCGRFPPQVGERPAPARSGGGLGPTGASFAERKENGPTWRTAHLPLGIWFPQNQQWREV